MATDESRKRIVETAAQLFNSRGIRAFARILDIETHAVRDFRQ